MAAVLHTPPARQHIEENKRWKLKVPVCPAAQNDASNPHDELSLLKDLAFSTENNLAKHF